VNYPHPEATANPPSSSVQPGEVLHPPCEPFKHVFGEIEDPVGLAAVLEPYQTPEGHTERGHLARELVERAIQTEGWRYDPGDTRSAPQRARDALQCGSCIMRGLCPGPAEFEITHEVEEAQRLMAMFADGPVWLKRARLHNIQMTEKKFSDITSDLETWTAALQSGFSIRALLGPIRNQRDKPLTRDDLPEALRQLTSAKQNETFRADLLEFDDCDYAIRVVDMTANNGYQGTLPDEEAFGVLISKFLNTMMLVDQDLNPQILSARLQKPVRSFDGGLVAEFRKGGKDRLYVAAQKEATGSITDTGKPIYQIFMLGWHGDSESSQQKFYDSTGLTNLGQS